MEKYVTLYITEDGGESSFVIESERLAELSMTHFGKTLEEFIADHDSCDVEEIRAWLTLPHAFSIADIENIFEEFRDKSGWKGLDAESAVECFIDYLKRRR